MSEREAQLQAECERLITRNGQLEARLAEERGWRNQIKAAIAPVTALAAVEHGR